MRLAGYDFHAVGYEEGRTLAGGTSVLRALMMVMN